MAPENIRQKPKVSFLLPNDPHQRSEDVLSDLDFSCTYQISRQASQPHNKQILQPCCLVNWLCLSAFATLLTAVTEYLTGAASGRKEGRVCLGSRLEGPARYGGDVARAYGVHSHREAWTLC